MVTGSIKANAPTLFMKAERVAARLPVAAVCCRGLPLAGASKRTRWSTRPEICKARPMTSTAPTVITAGWPKPEKASSGATSPR